MTECNRDYEKWVNAVSLAIKAGQTKVREIHIKQKHNQEINGNYNETHSVIQFSNICTIPKDDSVILSKDLNRNIEGSLSTVSHYDEEYGNAIDNELSKSGYVPNTNQRHQRFKQKMPSLRTTNKLRFGSEVQTVQKNSEVDMQNHDLRPVNDDEDDFIFGKRKRGLDDEVKSFYSQEDLHLARLSNPVEETNKLILIPTVAELELNLNTSEPNNSIKPNSIDHLNTELTKKKINRCINESEESHDKDKLKNSKGEKESIRSRMSKFGSKVIDKRTLKQLNRNPNTDLQQQGVTPISKKIILEATASSTERTARKNRKSSNSNRISKASKSLQHGKKSTLSENDAHDSGLKVKSLRSKNKPPRVNYVNPGTHSLQKIPGIWSVKITIEHCLENNQNDSALETFQEGTELAKTQETLQHKPSFQILLECLQWTEQQNSETKAIIKSFHEVLRFHSEISEILSRCRDRYTGLMNSDVLDQIFLTGKVLKSLLEFSHEYENIDCISKEICMYLLMISFLLTYSKN